MPYQDIADLPDSVKNHLPKHAAEIFIAAFNNALKDLSVRTHLCSNCGYTQQRDIVAAEVMLAWYSNNLQELGTGFLDVDDCSSTSRTCSFQAGSMKQLGRAKRQKSYSTGGDVETPPST